MESDVSEKTVLIWPLVEWKLGTIGRAYASQKLGSHHAYIPTKPRQSFIAFSNPSAGSSWPITLSHPMLSGDISSLHQVPWSTIIHVLLLWRSETGKATIFLLSRTAMLLPFIVASKITRIVQATKFRLDRRNIWDIVASKFNVWTFSAENVYVTVCCVVKVRRRKEQYLKQLAN